MARRKNSGLGEALFDLTAALPWWVGVVLAVIAYAVLHRYAVMEVPTTLSAGQKGGDMLSAVVIKGLASGGQYLVPFILLAAAAASALGRRKRQGLIAKAGNDATGAALRTMSWRDFELLVGEAFRLRGYAVTELGGNGADGGVDLKLTRGGETFLVQCKRWKAYQVSVEVVRELYGVMAAQGAAGGFVVTSGTFTEPARNFAQGRNIELIDGPALQKMIDAVRPAVANKEKRQAHRLWLWLWLLRQRQRQRRFARCVAVPWCGAWPNGAPMQANRFGVAAVMRRPSAEGLGLSRSEFFGLAYGAAVLVPLSASSFNAASRSGVPTSVQRPV